MSNYPLGAEHDKNAPFNKEELKGETIGLFEYLENLEMPYEVRCELQTLNFNLQLAKKSLVHIQKDYAEDGRIEASKLVLSIQRLISEPQIFIENE
jgi:hypothetical protein